MDGHAYFGRVGARGGARCRGNTYVAGQLLGGEFPATRPLQSDGGLFLIKLNSAGDLVFAAAIGTRRYLDVFGGSALERDGSVWIAGSTSLPNLAVTPGGSRIRDNDVGDFFVIAMPSEGDCVAVATYLGGSLLETTVGIVVDPGGGVWVAGRTSSPDFPLTPGALRWDYDGIDGFVARRRRDGSLAYSTRASVHPSGTRCLRSRSVATPAQHEESTNASSVDGCASPPFLYRPGFS